MTKGKKFWESNWFANTKTDEKNDDGRFLINNFTETSCKFCE